MGLKAAKKSMILAYDLGGTKLKAGLISTNGKILTVLTEPAQIPLGADAVVAQFVAMKEKLLAAHPRIRLHPQVGIASAGPLNPKTGDLLDPTNFRLKSGRRWGVVQFQKKIERALLLPVSIDNDAACAVQGEQWKGGAQGCHNLAILTLGTGLGTAFICDNQLVRAGRHLHTEAGHISLDANDKTALCGCGNYGCAEAYLSATGFARRFSRLYKRTFSPHEIVALAQKGDRRAKKAFEEYGALLARTLHDVTVLFCPQKIALAGGFSENHSYFLKHCQSLLKILLRNRRRGIDLLPAVYVSPLASEAPLMGAACIALNA